MVKLLAEAQKIARKPALSRRYGAAVNDYRRPDEWIMSGNGGKRARAAAGPGESRRNAGMNMERNEVTFIKHMILGISTFHDGDITLKSGYIG